jgi:hypothetical protein
MHIPESIRHKLAAGWVEHIPLTFLTDQYCTRTNKSKSQRDAWQLDESSGVLLAVPRPLPSEGENHLSFAEWHQAWKRLLNLINEFLPEKHASWLNHFQRVTGKDGLSTQWDLWLSYDIEAR